LLLVWALSYDTSTDLLPIVIKHISDDEAISTQFGCILGKHKVGDLLIAIATPGRIDPRTNKLNKSELALLDSLLIYLPNTLQARKTAFSRARLTEELYARARELTVKNNDQVALITLAKFKREKDIPLILKNKTGDKPDEGFSYTYEAIREFPHAAFLPLLREKVSEPSHHGNWNPEWIQLYEAIASYKNNSALELFKITLSQPGHRNTKEYRIKYILNALQSFYSPIYDSFLWEIWAL
jgi:hypothetical protein